MYALSSCELKVENIIKPHSYMTRKVKFLKSCVLKHLWKAEDIKSKGAAYALVAITSQNCWNWTALGTDG